MSEIYITLAQKEIVEAILKRYRYLVFGSRVNNTHRQFSDLDICLLGSQLSLAERGDLREAFSNSCLPFVVDLLIYDEVSPSFQKIIDAEGIELSQATCMLV